MQSLKKTARQQKVLRTDETKNNLYQNDEIEECEGLEEQPQSTTPHPSHTEVILLWFGHVWLQMELLYMT